MYHNIMTHICGKCCKKFILKADYTRHINRKYSCDRPSTKCEFCDKELAHKSSLYRHEKTCKAKAQPLTITNNNLINTVNNQTMNVDNLNNVNVDNVKVVKFGNENLSYISDDLYRHILGRGIKAIEEFIGHSHFNKKHPENHNLYIANIRDEYLVLYDGDKWTINRRDEKLEDIIYAKSDFLCRKFEELESTMNPKDAYKFKKYLEVKDEAYTLNRIKGDLKIRLYNERSMPLKIRRLMELEETILLRRCAELNADNNLKGMNTLLSNVHDIGALVEHLKSNQQT
jgi:hypothetical protein